MKALFVRCYGKLTADMMIGGLIDMLSLIHISEPTRH